MTTLIATPLQVPAGTAAAPAIKFGAGATGFFRTGTNIGLAVKGVEVARFTTTGGLTSPGQVTGLSGTAAPATAGAVAAGVPLSLYSNGITIEATTNTPTHARPKGSLCINLGGSSTSTRMYVASDAVGGWTNFTTAA